MSIPDITTNNFISTFTTDELWVGGKRLEADPSTWGWKDGTTWSFTNWYEGKPNSESQECLVSNFEYDEGAAKWDDRLCDQEKNFVCQQPVIVPEFPATTLET